MKARILLAIVAALLLNACNSRITAGKPQPAKKLIARMYNSGFPDGHDTWNGMGAASDSKIYYVLSSEKPDVAARMFSLDPASGRIRQIADLTEACGEKDMHAVSQGKSHTNFVEANGKLYFATHLGYYSTIDGVERAGIPPAGMKPYPGGHLLAYDMASGKFEDLARAPAGEGIITFNMDTRRRRLYGITWPSGHFLRYDLERRELRDLGPFFEQGEIGKGATYRTICRSLAIDPEDGSVYFTTGEGLIHRYRLDRDAVETVAGDNLRKDYFGSFDFSAPGSMAYNWRQTFYYPGDRMIYGVHGNSGYLFRFDPRAEHVEVLQRITSEPSQRSGMYDRFNYGYLGFTLGPDGQTIYYLTGGPAQGKGSKQEEDLHLITYHIPTAHYIDHGAIFFADGGRALNVNSIAVGRDGTVYAISSVPRAGGRNHADLIAIPPVL